MSKNHFLNLYVVKIGLQGSNQPIPFEMVVDSIGKPKDFYHIAKEFILYIANFRNDTNEESVIEADPKKVNFMESQRKIKGFLSAGSYGSEGNLLNTTNGKKKHIPFEHAPTFDHYFEFYLPPGGERGILALHAIGNKGCKTMFEDAFKEFLSSKYSHLKIGIKPLKIDFQSDAKTFHKHFRVEKVKKNIYVQKRVEDKNDGSSRNEEKVIIETEIRIGRGSKNALFPFDDLISAKNPVTPIKQIFRRYSESVQNEFTKFDVTVDMDGQKKTVRMGQEVVFEMSFDISEAVNKTMKRKFTIEGMANICREFVEHAIGKII